MMLVIALAAIGLTFHFLSGVGIIRFPDVYNRLHAATMGTTFGTIFIALAIAAYCLSNWSQPNTVMLFHTFIAVGALLLTNPTASHAIARAAHRAGASPGPIDAYAGVKK